jgi:hypothetical protein
LKIPKSVRVLTLPLTVAVLVISTTSIPKANAQSIETNTNRFGLDYRGFDTTSPTPSILNPPSFGSAGWDECSRTCNGDPNCRAWTYVKPGIQGPNAKCWLKKAIPAATANNCCTSGVAVHEIEPETNRFGLDYKNISIQVPVENKTGAEICKSKCDLDGSQCMAWTYVKPGIQGPNGQCWLKKGVPLAVTDKCCVSGVKPPAPPR